MVSNVLTVDHLEVPSDEFGVLSFCTREITLVISVSGNASKLRGLFNSWLSAFETPPILEKAIIYTGHEPSFVASSPAF